MEFDEGLRHLKNYISKNGSSKVPYTYKTEDNITLGKWVSRQRELYHAGRLSSDRIVKLDEVGFIWEVDHKNAQREGSDASFEEFFKRLKEYKKTYGDCDVPQTYICRDGYRLGAAVNKKRVRPERMTEEQIKRLDSIGFLFRSKYAKPWNIKGNYSTRR